MSHSYENLLLATACQSKTDIALCVNFLFHILFNTLVYGRAKEMARARTSGSDDNVNFGPPVIARAV